MWRVITQDSSSTYQERAVDARVLLIPKEQVVAPSQRAPLLLDLADPLVVSIFDEHSTRHQIRGSPHLEEHGLAVGVEDGCLEGPSRSEQLTPNRRSESPVFFRQQGNDVTMLVPHAVVLALLESENQLSIFDVARDDKGASLRHGLDELPGRVWRVLQAIQCILNTSGKTREAASQFEAELGRTSKRRAQHPKLAQAGLARLRVWDIVTCAN